MKNKEAIKEKSKNWYKNLSDEEEKNKIKEYQSERYQELIQYKKEALQPKWILITMSLKFGEIKVDKKEFRESKETVDLNLFNTNKIVSDKLNLKKLISIKLAKKMVNLLDHYALIYFKWVDLLDTLMVTEKTCHLSENEEIIIKYNKIWKKITKTYGFKLDSQPVYDKKYIKTKLKTYDDKINPAFLDSEIQKE